MNNLNDLAIQIDTLNEHVPLAAGELKKDAVRAIVKGLTEVTPADTGGAISNWLVSNDLPEIAIVPPFAPSPRGRMVNGKWMHSVDPEVTAHANVSPTQEAAEAAIEASLPGQSLFIANSLPYIEKLDQGSSTQAPYGFVDRAVILGRSIVDRAKFLL